MVSYNEKCAGMRRWCIVEDGDGLHYVKECIVTADPHPSVKFANVRMSSTGDVVAVELKNLFQTRGLAYSALNVRYGEEYEIGGYENE